jgi:hypothetical protein
MRFLHRLLPAAAVLPALFIVTVGPTLLTESVRAAGPQPVRGASAKPAKPKIVLFAGGADADVKVLRDTLEKVPGIKFKADELKFGDFARDGGLHTEFFTIEIADLAKTDIGAIAKAVASANTSKKEKCPPALYVIIGYKPDSVKKEQLRTVLAKVKGVQADRSWPGDSNIWIRVDGSGQARLVQITTALHFAGIKIRDPIADIVK